MDIAAFIMALLALIASTVSLTLQVFTKKAEKAELTPVEDPFEEFKEEEVQAPILSAAPVTVDRDALAALETIRKEELRRMDELFSNPDTPYTGIDEEFST